MKNDKNKELEMKEEKRKKELDINDDNYEAYSELLCAKNGVTYKNKVKWMRLSVALGVLGLIGTLMLGIGLPVWLGTNMALSIVMVIPIVTLGVGGSLVGCEKLLEIFTIHDLKKDFPDLYFDVDKKKLKSALKRYEELSKVPEDIEQRKKEHMSIFDKDKDEMTTKERIEYLNREKEFWENYAIKEKYEKEDNKVKNKSDDIMRMKN